MCLTRSRKPQQRWSASLQVAFLAIFSARLLSAFLNLVHDCDEVFNYWEPLDYLFYGYGLQTWEYRYDSQKLKKVIESIWISSDDVPMWLLAARSMPCAPTGIYCCIRAHWHRQLCCSEMLAVSCTFVSQRLPDLPDCQQVIAEFIYRKTAGLLCDQGWLGICLCSS